MPISEDVYLYRECNLYGIVFLVQKMFQTKCFVWLKFDKIILHKIESFWYNDKMLEKTAVFLNMTSAKH